MDLAVLRRRRTALLGIAVPRREARPPAAMTGEGGPIGFEVRSALYGHADGIKTVNYIYGLGGRDVRVNDFYEAFEELENATKGATAPGCRYLGVRE